MKHSKKILALAMSVAVVASIAAAGTLAYLTSNGSVTNTFNVGTEGQVAIKLDEAPVNPETGKEVEGTRVDKNTYNHSVPGSVFDKDPMVTYTANSANNYVYMALKDGMGTYTLNGETKNFASFDINTAWTAVTAEDLAEAGFTGTLADNVTVYKHAVVDAANAEENATLEKLFTKVTIASEAESSPANGATVEVKAFAIQAENVTAELALKTAADWFVTAGFGTAAQG